MTQDVVPRAAPLVQVLPRPLIATAPRQPQAQSVVESGPQGAPGPAFAGYGYAQYVEASADAPAALAPGVRVPLSMGVDPAQTTDALAGPFAGFPFFDGQSVRARAPGDAYDIRVTVTVTALVAGGTLTVDLAIVGSAALTDSDTASISAPAGQPQRLAFRLKVFPKAQFAAHGAGLYVTSTVAASVQSETVVVEPISVRP